MKKMLLLVALCGSAAHADTIQFIHQGFGGSGTLNGVPFSNVDFTFTSLGETAAIGTYSAGFYLTHTSSIINIEGIGDVTILTGTRTYVNQNAGQVGYSRDSDGTDLFDGPLNDALKTWDMTTAIGPIAGIGNLFQWQLGDIVTDKGVLFFDAKNGEGVFQAVIVPAPGVGAMTLVGAGALLRRRR